jgi:hypothetical protein
MQQNYPANPSPIKHQDVWQRHSSAIKAQCRLQLGALRRCTASKTSSITALPALRCFIQPASPTSASTSSLLLLLLLLVLLLLLH